MCRRSDGFDQGIAVLGRAAAPRPSVPFASGVHRGPYLQFADRPVDPRSRTRWASTPRRLRTLCRQPWCPPFAKVRRGHPPAIHSTTACRDQRTARPTRTGCGNRPRVSSVRTVRTLTPSSRASSGADNKSGSSAVEGRVFMDDPPTDEAPVSSRRLQPPRRQTAPVGGWPSSTESSLAVARQVR